MRRRTNIKKIGILTGGGDCAGLNAVIRSITKKGIFEYNMMVIGIIDGFSGLLNRNVKRLKVEDVSGILPLGGTILGTSNIANPFRVPINNGDKLRFEDHSERVIDYYKELELDVLFCIGGDGTLTIAHQLGKMGMDIIGIPKTIDNDIFGTDITFGFNSAVEIITKATDALHSTAMSHHRVMILEVMGRNAGWLALYGGLAGGGDIILIPEIPYNIDKVCEKVRQRNLHGKRFSVIVISEGARPIGGEKVIKRIVKESTEQVRYGGIGINIGDDIERCTGLETRVTILGHLQRSGAPTGFDRILGTGFGTAALDLALQGEFGKMVALKGEAISSIPLEEVAGRQRLIPIDSPVLRSARSVGTSFGD
ncbi:MAG: ATP-dependent 6-phosphofructokinase [Nitrospinae bacterium]|nr:ATP-dependent 6-phosphofructokinase [Nitrospinota bacterium]